MHIINKRTVFPNIVFNLFKLSIDLKIKIKPNNIKNFKKKKFKIESRQNMINIFANITSKTSFNIMIKILTETQLGNINIQNQSKFHSLTFNSNKQNRM